MSIPSKTRIAGSFLAAIVVCFMIIGGSLGVFYDGDAFNVLYDHQVSRGVQNSVDHA